jgi:hypothetical protein
MVRKQLKLLLSAGISPLSYFDRDYRKYFYLAECLSMVDLSLTVKSGVHQPFPAAAIPCSSHPLPPAIPCHQLAAASTSARSKTHPRPAPLLAPSNQHATVHRCPYQLHRNLPAHPTTLPCLLIHPLPSLYTLVPSPFNPHRLTLQACSTACGAAP